MPAVPRHVPTPRSSGAGSSRRPSPSVIRLRPWVKRTAAARLAQQSKTELFAAPRRSTSRAVPRCPRPSSSAPSTRRRPGPADTTSTGVEVHRMLFRRRSRKDRMLAAAGRLLPPRRAAAMAAVISSLAALICCQLERVGAAAEADLMRRRNRRETGHRSSCAGATASSMATAGPPAVQLQAITTGRAQLVEGGDGGAAIPGSETDAWTPPRQPRFRRPKDLHT